MCGRAERMDDPSSQRIRCSVWQWKHGGIRIWKEENCVIQEKYDYTQAPSWIYFEPCKHDWHVLRFRHVSTSSKELLQSVDYPPSPVYEKGFPSSSNIVSGILELSFVIALIDMDKHVKAPENAQWFVLSRKLLQWCVTSFARSVEQDAWLCTVAWKKELLQWLAWVSGSMESLLALMRIVLREIDDPLSAVDFCRTSAEQLLRLYQEWRRWAAAALYPVKAKSVKSTSWRNVWQARRAVQLA